MVYYKISTAYKTLNASQEHSLLRNKPMPLLLVDVSIYPISIHFMVISRDFAKPIELSELLMGFFLAAMKNNNAQYHWTGFCPRNLILFEVISKKIHNILDKQWKPYCILHFSGLLSPSSQSWLRYEFKLSSVISWGSKYHQPIILVLFFRVADLRNDFVSLIMLRKLLLKFENPATEFFWCMHFLSLLCGVLLLSFFNRSLLIYLEAYTSVHIQYLQMYFCK